MIILLLVLVAVLGEKVDSLEREGVVTRTMLFQSTEYIRILNDKYAECKETLGDYRTMVRECNVMQNVPRFNYMPFEFSKPNITPIEPYIIDNLTVPNNFTLPHLKTLNLTDKDFYVRGACNISDPFSPCL
jgi:hypothetical protein